MKTYLITLTRELEDIDQESALEKFEYELKNGLYDPESIILREENPKSVNQKYIEDLKEFEYRFRDGMVFTDEQKQEIFLVCSEIMALTRE